MTKLTSPALALAVALLAPLASQAQLRVGDSFDPYPTLTSPALQSLYLAAEPPAASLFPFRLANEDPPLSYNRPPRITIGLRLTPSADANQSSALVLAATLGGNALNGQCHIYSLTPCQSTIPSTLSELTKIRSLSLTYRARY